MLSSLEQKNHIPKHSSFSARPFAITAPKCLDCLSIMFYSITRCQLSHHSRFCNKELNFKIYDTAS